MAGSERTNSLAHRVTMLSDVDLVCAKTLGTGRNSYLCHEGSKGEPGLAEDCEIAEADPAGDK